MLCQGKLLKMFIVSLRFPLPYNHSLGGDELGATYVSVVPGKTPQDIIVSLRFPISYNNSLGRDEQVNVVPGKAPQDIYSKSNTKLCIKFSIKHEI